MEFINTLLLSRLQFGFTVSFHIIFPAMSIGLASFLMFLEGMWLWKKDKVYLELYHFWVRIFAINFGMGVVSGLVMAFEFGTNWSQFSAFAGSITGPLLTYEVLTAFFLEAGFLGVQLLGFGKVGPKTHFFATVMVALGTLISATWILASNSWMQTPAGIDIVDGRVIPVDWLKVVFNPSFHYRLVHMVLAAYLCTVLLVAAASAWHLLRGNRSRAIKVNFSIALWSLLILMPLQLLAGDAHGLNTLKYQPTKLAAMEGHWQNEPGKSVPLVLFALPDNEQETNHFAIELPHVGSLILTHSWNGQIPALKNVPKADRPNVPVVFWSFRVMVGLGMLILLLALVGVAMRYKQRLYTQRAFLKFALWMGPSGLIALLAGWFTTEFGRQPWVVYGLLRTHDAVSAHSFAAVASGLILIILLYVAIFGIGLFYALRLIGQGPQPQAESADDEQWHANDAAGAKENQ